MQSRISVLVTTQTARGGGAFGKGERSGAYSLLTPKKGTKNELETNLFVRATKHSRQGREPTRSLPNFIVLHSQKLQFYPRDPKAVVQS